MIDSYVSRLFKFSGAGNDFVVLDGRQGGMEPFRQPGRIGELCQEYHTDGLMILTRADQPSHYDFVMEFYNPDGSGGMMCGVTSIISSPRTGSIRPKFCRRRFLEKNGLFG